MATTHERYVAEITAKTSGAIGPLTAFDKQVAKSNKQFDKFAANIGVSSATLKSGLATLGGAALGAGLVAGLQKMVTGYADAAKAAGDLANATGGSVQEVSAMQAALQDAGVSAQQSAAMLTKFTTAAGSKKGADALAALNVQLVKGPKGATDYAATMVKTVDAIELIGDAATRNQKLVALFGKAGAKAFQDLQASGLSLSEAMAAVSRNRIFTEADVKAAADYDDAMDSLAANGQALGNTLGRALVPALNGMLTAVTPLVEGLAKVPPAIDAITVAGVAMAGVFLSSNPLGWAIAAAAAVAALGGALHNDLNQQVEEARDRLKELEDQGLATGDALRQTAAEVEESTGFFHNLWAAIEGSVSSGENANPVTAIQEVIDAMRAGGRDADKYAADLGVVGDSAAALASPAAAAGDAMKELNAVIASGNPDIDAYRDAVEAAAQAQATNEANTRAAADAVDAYRASTDQAWQATLNLVDAETASSDAHQALINGIAAVGDARSRAAQAEGRAADGASKAERDRARAQAADAEKDLKAARKRVRDAKADAGKAFTVGELADARARIRAAQADVEAAQKRRRNAVAAGPSAAEKASARQSAAQARKDASEAEQRVVRLAQAQAEADVARANATAKLKNQTIELADQHDLYIKSLQESKKLATTDTEQRAIQDLIDKLKEAQHTAGEGIIIGKIRFKEGTAKKQIDTLKNTIKDALKGQVPWALGSQAQAQLDSLKIPVSIAGVDQAKDDLLDVTKGKDGKDRKARVNVDLVGDATAKAKLDELAQDRTAKITYSIVPPTTTPGGPTYLPRAGGQAMPTSLAVSGGGANGAGVNYAPTIVNNYPKPERASDSIASSLRVARYLSGV